MLTWLEVLKEVVDWPEPIRVVDIANYYDMTRGEASSRIHRLRYWGFVKYFDPIVKGRAGFVVTKYGKKRAEQG